MAIYKMVGDKDRLDKVEPTSFGQEGVLERSDLQRILRDQPEVLEEGLLIISEEFANWQDSNRRIDLLGLDSNGRLAVIELKRGDTGEHMDLQAIRYAAMVSILTSDDIVEAHRAYLNKWSIEGDAEERIQAHLSGTNFDDIYTEAPRIILVSAGFSKELTTSVLWLNENGLDITCIQLQPYRNGSDLLIESSQIVPVPGTEELLVQAQERRSENKRQRTSSGGAVPFEESIETAPPEYQADMKRIVSWYQALEKDGLAITETNGRSLSNSSVRTYQRRIPLAKVNYNKDDTRGPWIHLDAPKMREYAPQTVPLLVNITGIDYSNRDKTRPIKLSQVSNEMLNALTDAYREANSLLTND